MSVAAVQQVQVFAFDGEQKLKKWNASLDEAERMILRNQATWEIRNRSILLNRLGEWWDSGTRTSRPGPLGGQIYTTTNDQGRVNGFRYLAVKDKPVFYQAILTNIKMILAILALTGA